MLLPTLFRRLAVPAVAAGLAVAGLSLPAQAEDDFDMPLVGILGPETVTVISGQSKTVKIEVMNAGAAAAEDVVLNFGNTKYPVTADLGFTPPAGCTGTSCAIGDLKAGERRIVRFAVKPDAPARVLPLTAVVDGEESFDTTMAVVRTAKGGVDLEMGDIANLKLGRGASADVPFAVRNTGDQDVKALGLVVVSLYDGVEPLLDYRNCESDEGFGGFVCVFNEPLTAGGTFALPAATPLRVQVGGNTPGPFAYPVMVAAVGLTDEFVFDFAARTAGAKGRELKLEALATASAEEPEPVEDLNEDDNFTDFTVSVPKSSADSAAVGGEFRGAIGEKRTVEVGVRNLGPTDLVPPSFDFLPYLHVRVPGGIKLTQIDKRCLPGTSPADMDEENFESLAGRDYVCLLFDGLPKNTFSLFPFTGEILAGEHGAGKVTVDGGVQDGKSGNDTAAVTVELTEGGSGGGLPITGAPAGLVAGAGTVLLMAGAVALRLARRRRIVTVVD